mgnify:CR=1 FL=1
MCIRDRYLRYSELNKWKYELIDISDTDHDGVKEVIINISGGEDVKLYEIHEIAAHVKKQCKENVYINVGNTIEKIGDGKIFITNVEEVIRIRTGETGSEAI